MPTAVTTAARRKARWLPAYHRCEQRLPYPEMVPVGTTFDCGCRKVWISTGKEWRPAGPIQSAAHYLALVRSSRAEARAEAAYERSIPPAPADDTPVGYYL